MTRFGEILPFLQNLQSWAFFWGFLLFGKILDWLWQILCAIGQVLNDVNGQILNNKLAIWSPCFRQKPIICSIASKQTNKRSTARVRNSELASEREILGSRKRSFFLLKLTDWVGPVIQIGSSTGFFPWFPAILSEIYFSWSSCLGIP